MNEMVLFVLLAALAQRPLPASDPTLALHARPADARQGSVSVRAAVGRELEFELGVRALPPEGADVQVELDALWSPPGGELHPLGAGCSVSPFSAAQARFENEVVVALHSTAWELNVLEYVNGILLPRYHAAMPARIEALDIGDADNDGLDDIVIGLDGTHMPGHLRILRHDPVADTLEMELVSGDLQNHVEDLEIGDADNDGQNEIVFALEELVPTDPNVARVGLFRYQGGAWVGPEVVDPTTTLSCQDVAIGDVDGDGANEVVAVYANIVGYPTQARQFRMYDRVAGQWIRTDLTPLETMEYQRGERMVLGDFDADGREEIVAGLHSGGNVGGLFVLEPDASGVWSLTQFAAGVGLVDALDVGDREGDPYLDLVAGIRSGWAAQFYAWEYVQGAWTATVLSGGFGSATLWDVALGDMDGDGCNEVLGADDDTLVVYVPQNTSPVLVHDFPVKIDSVQVGDIDNDALGCTIGFELPPSGRQNVPFRVRPAAAPGTAWDLVFRARSTVRAPGAPPRYEEALSRPIRVEIAP